ncbi:MAG: hypothetical protein U0802_12285 [Candidatus Binatia bacterium]
MVKLIFLCHRRPDITHERYVELLLRGHVPIALRHHPALRRYTVNIVERGPEDEAALDSIGELSFDSLADYRERLYDSPEGAARRRRRRRRAGSWVERTPARPPRWCRNPSSSARSARARRA